MATSGHLQSGWTLLAVVLCATSAAAFTTSSLHATLRQRHHEHVRYQGAFSNFEDLDEARKSFESMMDEHAHDIAGHPGVVSSACRRRKRIEIELLQSLRDSDDALEELVQLWMHEATPEDAQALKEMQEECSTGLVKEEALLRDMIVDHPRWCEPHIRLATLLFYKGRTEESIELAHRAREIKPWHFEIYPLLIMLSLRGPDPDFKRAVGWARVGLPARMGRRREAWVERAVEDAQAQWHRAEVLSEEILHAPDTPSEEFMWQ